MNRKLLLFDIDGTLISSGGAGSRALNRACQELLNEADVCGRVRLDGMTDRAIVRQILAPLNIEPSQTDGLIEKVLEKYLGYLSMEVKLSATYEVLPGIQKLLQCLEQNEQYVLALATGNLRQGAEIKLGRADLFRYFCCGGFGCDAEVRSLLVAKAIERACQLCGHEFAKENIFVIGDTHHDVLAGQALGVKTIAVSTGSFSREALANYAPSFVLENLADEENFFAAFEK